VKLLPVPESLRRVARLLEEFSAPSVAFSLDPGKAPAIGESRLGGSPDLAPNFQWPTNKGDPIDFLLQINLARAAPLDQTGSLPPSGLLSFFYDLEKQPWGFDPEDMLGFRVCFTPSGVSLHSMPVPRRSFALEQCFIYFRSGLSLPHYGSRAYEQFDKTAHLTEEEVEAYFEYCSEVERLGRPNLGDGNHRLLGYSANIQGDMQLEATLVTNGLYCGNASGYKDPRREVLESGADDWILLLQLDSDDTAGLMWGDVGTLYYWIRKQDLAACRFDRVWMALQCS
jgi:uncharacterized protein YwqG